MNATCTLRQHIAEQNIKLTPMLQQYVAAKEAHPDAVLFFRMGDFYEMFFDDAEISAKVLSLRLTSRAKNGPGIPMAGVPVHAARGYMVKMLKEGYKVAVCEQVEDPKLTNEIVKREVTRVLTPGTILEGDLLDARENSYLACAVKDAGSYGVAWVDVSTAAFFAETCTPEELAERLAWIEPQEVLVEDELSLPLRATLTRIPRASRAQRQQLLTRHFKVKSLAGFGFSDGSPALMAAAAILAYLERKFADALVSLRSLKPARKQGCTTMGPTTRRRLEILETEVERKRKGSLIWVLDRTATAMGARQLRQWALSPLTDLVSIIARQDAVEELLGNLGFMGRLTGQLEGVADFERLATKIAANRANPRDLKSLADSLQQLAPLQEELRDVRSELLEELGRELPDFAPVVLDIHGTLVDEPPAHLKDGEVIRSGVSAELDELKTIASEGTTAIAGFQAREQERTEIPSLKVGYNRVFGYYLEVTHAHREKVPEHWVRKQTLKNAERYNTPELKEFEDKVLGARERSEQLEQELFAALRSRVAEHLDAVIQAGQTIAVLDVLTSLAKLARARSYIRPRLVDEPVLEIEGGRHPVLEAMAGKDPFVPNDTFLGAEHGRLALITGPNMAGKSTYIRQVALLCLMAQMGSFIPAEAATIGIVDKIFTRIGASDELHRGMSTFMVEMSETAAILRNATERSLIVLDEIGRGTSTVDGLSLAWAIAEHIHDKLQARTLFATHYHELIAMAESSPGVRNYNISVKEWKDEIVFLREIVAGGTDKSYGINVARLAGMPEGVTRRAVEVLAGLESHASPAPPPSRKNQPKQLLLFADEKELFLQRLAQLDADGITPRQALEVLYELRVESRQLLGEP